MGAIWLRCRDARRDGAFRVAGGATLQQSIDVAGRHAGFLEDREAMLAEARGMTGDFQGGTVPAAGDAGVANWSIGRMCEGLKETDRCEMRVVDQRVKIVHRRAGDVAAFEQP